jgi:capsular exopolysaccharide synthesis family protein
MNFFFQAIKRAEGEEVASPAPEAAVVAVASAVHTEAPDLGTPIAVATQKRRMLTLANTVKKLVAVLSPPVLDGHVAAMEECRVIRSRVRDIMRQGKKKTLMTTSSSPEEGKTLISVNLAFALSQLEGTRVLLVDADLRRPAVTTFLGSKAERGLHSYLLDGASFDDVVCEVSPKLHIVLTNEIGADAAELLQGRRMQAFLGEAAARYDLVIIDAPPLFPIVDAQVLASIVDAALLVVRADSTSFELAGEAERVLKGKYIGAILNCGKPKRHGSYYGDDRYRQRVTPAG